MVIQGCCFSVKARLIFDEENGFCSVVYLALFVASTKSSMHNMYSNMIILDGKRNYCFLQLQWVRGHTGVYGANQFRLVSVCWKLDRECHVDFCMFLTPHELNFELLMKTQKKGKWKGMRESCLVYCYSGIQSLFEVVLLYKFHGNTKSASS